MRLVAAAGLHGPPSLETGDSVRWDSFIVKFRVEHVSSIWVVSGKIQKIYTGEDDQKSTEQGDGVDSVGGVESLEKDK